MQSKLNAAFADEVKPIPVIPVLTIERADTAVPLAAALVAGGLSVLEITLRMPAAIEAIRAIAARVPGAIVGAGTVLTPDHAQAAMAAGARFLVSPGMTPRLAEAATRWPVPFLPGAATASEAMVLADLGYRFLKFFPAETAGGAAALKAIGAPIQSLVFCPTGGVDAARAPEYLKLANVACVGGSWVAPGKAVAAGDWRTITLLAREARALRA